MTSSEDRLRLADEAARTLPDTPAGDEIVRQLYRWATGDQEAGHQLGLVATYNETGEPE
jgi:hypothetical protein